MPCRLFPLTNSAGHFKHDISLTSATNHDNLAPVARAGTAGKLADKAQNFLMQEKEKCQTNGISVR